MASKVILLRGINLGPTNRLAMPALREALAAAGFEDARTYVQSGNIVLTSERGESELAESLEQLISERFGLTVPVVVRSRPELARVVAENPFAEQAQRDPKRLQVTFIEGTPRPDLRELLATLAAESERVLVGDREIYAWHPDGVARSKLWAKLAAKGGLGKDVTATSRNWTTVLTLLEMAASNGG